MTIGERISTTFAFFLASFLTMTAIWFVTSFIGAKSGGELYMSFMVVWYFSGFMSFLAFLVPKLADALLSKIWNLMSFGK